MFTELFSFSDSKKTKTEPKIYEFYANLPNNMLLNIEQFAISENEARQWLGYLNQIFATRSLDELIKAFAVPLYNFSINEYSNQLYEKPFRDFQNLVKDPSTVFEMKVVDDMDATYFGRRFGESSMQVSFFDKVTGKEIISANFVKQEIAPHKFQTYLEARIKYNLGDNYANINEVITDYTEAATAFARTNKNEEDPVKLCLAVNEKLDELRVIFSGRIEWVPQLTRPNRLVYDLLHNLQSEALMEAQFIQGRIGSSRNCITGIMFAATRYCQVGRYPEEALKLDLQRIDTLLAANVDINARDRWGRTALFYVAFPRLMFGQGALPGRALMTKKLLDAGADPSITDVLGKTALDYYPLDGGSPHDGTELLRESLKNRKGARLSV